ncbi:hornerin-like [Iris pallida]|uniref:Hornerin-like n=1 Tax=Iris pallida TaxID=29817 RepID=A0AAX6GIQ6_IRIPA|nr:hornerin-like [Iris pallida]
MDGAQAPTHTRHRGDRHAPMSRRARRPPQNRGASPGGAAVGAILVVVQ